MGIFWSTSSSCGIPGQQRGVFDLGNTVVSDDFRVTVFKADKKDKAAKENLAETLVVAGEEIGCLFSFVLHTSFHQGELAHYIPMGDLDQAWKKPQTYNKDKGVKLTFAREVSP